MHQLYHENLIPIPRPFSVNERAWIQGYSTISLVPRPFFRGEGLGMKYLAYHCTCNGYWALLRVQEPWDMAALVSQASAEW